MYESWGFALTVGAAMVALAMLAARFGAMIGSW